MYAQTAVKSYILHRNGVYGIVMRGVQKCTGAGASLRDRNVLPLCCINLDTATEHTWRSGGIWMLLDNDKMLPQLEKVMEQSFAEPTGEAGMYDCIFAGCFFENNRISFCF